MTEAPIQTEKAQTQEKRCMGFHFTKKKKEEEEDLYSGKQDL